MTEPASGRGKDLLVWATRTALDYNECTKKLDLLIEAVKK